MVDSSVLDQCSKELKEALLQKKNEFDFELRSIDHKLTLIYEDQSVFCDFLNAKYLTEVRQNYSRSEGVYSFLKSLSKEKKQLSILDLTAGLGRDLFKFVLAGHKVECYERDPVLYLLLKDGVSRFFESDDLKALKEQFKLEGDFSCKLHFGDSRKMLKKNKEFYDLIYFDPMFEDKRKKAAPKKHMQIIKGLVSRADVDKEAAIVDALKSSKVVVLKASSFSSKDLKPQRVLSFKGFSYYVFVRKN